MKSKITVAALAALIMVFGAVSYSNATSTTVTACAKKSTGALRVVAANKSCNKSERRISWGSQGAQGEQGIQGIQGIQGEQGIQGIPGTPGQDGADGGLAPLWISARQFERTSGDAEHAYYGTSAISGWPVEGFIFKDRAANSGGDEIQTHFAIPNAWRAYPYIDVTYYYTAKSGSGDIQLWKGAGSYQAGQNLAASLSWNQLHFGGINGAGTLEYHRWRFNINSAEIYALGVERSSDTGNTPDTNTDDVIFIGALVEPTGA